MFRINDGFDEVILPNPQLGNSEALDVEVTYIRSMDGSLFGYSKSSDAKLYTWDFANVEVGIMKDMRTFLIANRNKVVTVIDDYDTQITGKLKVSDVPFTIDKGGPADLRGSFQLIIEG